jgi:uncharacterized protein (DUF4213/DUF364 family)
MTLIESLISSVGDSEMTVKKIVAGPRWAMVISAHCGIAGLPCGQPILKTALPTLVGKPLSDVFHLSASTDPVEARLGVAALNAAMAAARPSSSFQPAGMPRAGGKTVGLVGEFAFTEQMKNLAGEVILVDEDEAEHRLPGLDIAIIPGSAIVEHRLEPLLRASAECYTIVYGPSTPLSPVLLDYGADQLVGVRITNPDKAAEFISSDTPNLMECPGIKPVVLRK